MLKLNTKFRLLLLNSGLGLLIALASSVTDLAHIVR